MQTRPPEVIAPSDPVVQIWSADGDFRGSGFFLAPRIVVTCAHVVERDEQVVIGWSGPDLDGTVLVRDPIDREGGKYYPPPDIAFIGVDVQDNPTAYLEPSPLGRDVDRLFIEGFSTMNPTGAVALERRVVPLIGESGNYRLLSDAHIVPGMSGSPVVEFEGAENIRGMLKSGRLAYGNSAYMIPVYEIKRTFRLNKSVLRSHMRDLPRLVRPRPGDPLHVLLTAQREVAKRYPYRVATLTRRDPPPLSSVYVEQRARATSGRASDEKPLVLTPPEMLHRHRNALIIGGPGGGKSTLVQQLVAASADWWLRDHAVGNGDEPNATEPPLGRVVAVRAAAQDLLGDGAWYESLARAVNNDLGWRLDVNLTAEHFERPPAPGADWLILVDGLDEVLDRAVRRDLVDMLGFRVGRYGSTSRFVVASRPLDDREFARLRASLTASNRIKRLGEYDLRPFDWPAVRTFAGNWFRPVGGEQSPVEPAEFLDAITTAGLAPLVEVPLLATIAAIVFEEKPEVPLPIDRAGLYETFVRVLLTMRVQRLGIRAALREQLAPLGQQVEAFGERMLDDRLACLSHLALQQLRHGRRIRDVLPEWLAEQYRRLPLGVTVEHMRALLLDTGLVAVYGDDLVFIHQSFAEYLASLLLVDEFDPDGWLRQVRRTGPDSLGLFTLAAWANAGHDPRPVVKELIGAGTQGEYPHLREVAAMIQDGGVLITDDVGEIIDLTETAVRRVRGPGEAVSAAVNEALRAILQRTRDTAKVVRLIVDARLSVRKRAEAARVLVTSATATDHSTGLTELIRLAYQTRLSDLDRLWALHVIVESAPEHERRHAVQRLAQYAETAAGLHVRMRAGELLARSGEDVAGAAALLRRSLDLRRPLAERAQSALLLSLYLDRDRPGAQRGAVDTGDVEFENRTWRPAPGREPERRDSYLVSVEYAMFQLAAAGHDMAVQVTERYVRTRPIGWAARGTAIIALARAGQDAAAWRAITIMASDPQVPAQSRLNLLIDFEQSVPSHSADVTRLLYAWVHDWRQHPRLRRAALHNLLPRMDDDEPLALALASAGELPTYLRAIAAFEYATTPERQQTAYHLLTALARDPGSTLRERLGCRARRAALAVLPWFNRLAERLASIG